MKQERRRLWIIAGFAAWAVLLGGSVAVSQPIAQQESKNPTLEQRIEIRANDYRQATAQVKQAEENLEKAKDTEAAIRGSLWELQALRRDQLETSATVETPTSGTKSSKRR